MFNFLNFVHCFIPQVYRELFILSVQLHSKFRMQQKNLEFYLRTWSTGFRFRYAFFNVEIVALHETINSLWLVNNAISYQKCERCWIYGPLYRHFNDLYSFFYFLIYFCIERIYCTHLLLYTHVLLVIWIHSFIFCALRSSQWYILFILQINICC